MSKPISDRTHGMRVKADHTARRLTPEQIRREKCERFKARGLERKAANIAKMAAMPKRSPREQLDRLNKATHIALKERAKIRVRLAEANAA